MIVGFTLQATLLSGAFLFSLIFTEAVPRLRFDPSLIAPPQAKRHFVPLAPTRSPVRVNFTRQPSQFYAPPRIPPDVVILDKLQATEPELSDAYPYEGFLPIGGADDGERPNFLFPDAEPTMSHTPPPPPPTKPVEGPSEPIRVSVMAPAALIHRVQPVYPPLAVQARIQGTVKLDAVINETGEVINLRVISGHPLLIRAAQDAVSQWRYQPTLLNSRPVAVITAVEVNFVLGGH